MWCYTKANEELWRTKNCEKKKITSSKTCFYCKATFTQKYNKDRHQKHTPRQFGSFCQEC